MSSPSFRFQHTRVCNDLRVSQIVHWLKPLRSPLICLAKRVELPAMRLGGRLSERTNCPDTSAG